MKQIAEANAKPDDKPLKQLESTIAQMQTEQDEIMEELNKYQDNIEQVIGKNQQDAEYKIDEL